MAKISTFVLIAGISLCAAFSGLAVNAQEKEVPQKSLQDSAQAVKFFEDQLNFTTNHHGAMSVVEGKTKNVTIVDVRRAEAFAEGHIPGAINLPFDKYDSFEGSETEFPALRKDGYNYVYCYYHMCNLSQKAAKKFASLGYPVKEVLGGFDDWKKHEHPIEK